MSSTEEPTAAEAWVNMLAALPNIHTSDTAQVEMKKGGRYTYKYASLPSILEVVRPVLADHGWAVTQDVGTAESGMPQVTTRFYHASGDLLTFGPLAMPAGSGAQAVGSAITYARRYALVAALGLAPDGDDDGQSAGRERELTPDEIADHLTNAAKTELYNRIMAPGDVDPEDGKALASETWPLILKQAELFEIRTETDRDAALAAIKDRFK